MIIAGQYFIAIVSLEVLSYRSLSQGVKKREQHQNKPADIIDGIFLYKGRDRCMKNVQLMQKDNTTYLLFI